MTSSLGWERGLTFPDVSASQLLHSPSLCVSDFPLPSKFSSFYSGPLGETGSLSSSSQVLGMHDWVSFLRLVLTELLWGRVGVSGKVVDRKDELIFIIDSPASKRGAVLGQTPFR